MALLCYPPWKWCVCDGIGGTVKRMARRFSLGRDGNNPINSATELYNWAKSAVTNIIFTFVSNDEYEAHKNIMFMRFNKFNSIKGVREIHCVIPDTNNTIITKNYSNSHIFKKIVLK